MTTKSELPSKHQSNPTRSFPCKSTQGSEVRLINLPQRPISYGIDHFHETYVSVVIDFLRLRNDSTHDRLQFPHTARLSLA